MHLLQFNVPFNVIALRMRDERNNTAHRYADSERPFRS